MKSSSLAACVVHHISHYARLRGASEKWKTSRVGINQFPLPPIWSDQKGPPFPQSVQADLGRMNAILLFLILPFFPRIQTRLLLVYIFSLVISQYLLNWLLPLKSGSVFGLQDPQQLKQLVFYWCSINFYCHCLKLVGFSLGVKYEICL